MVCVSFHVCNPLKLFFVSGIILGFLWLFAPIDFIYFGGAETLLYSLSLIALFALGLFVGSRRWSSTHISLYLSLSRVRRFVHLVALFGFAGLMLRIVERIYIRAGGAISSDFMANRELIADGGSAGLALVGGVFATWLMCLPFTVMLLRKGGDRRWRYFLLATLSVSYPLFDMLLQGSRSTLVMYGGILFVSFISLHRLRISISTAVLMPILMIVLVWSMGQVFTLRTSQMGLDPLLSMTHSGYAYFAPASEAVIGYLSASGLDGIGGLLYAYTHVCQYVLHGIYEFFFVVSSVEERSTAGLQTFYIPAKIISSLSGHGEIERVIAEGMLRPGVYTTLWGPMVYDFGFVGAVFASVFFGFGSGFVVRKVGRGNVEFLPLYLILFGFLLFAFVVNLFTSGTGQFALYGAILLLCLMRMRWFRLD